MTRLLIAAFAVLAIGLGAVFAAPPKAEPKSSDPAPGGAARYQKLSKGLLQEELKKLQKDILEAQKKMNDGDKAQNRANETYEMAPDNEKAEALIRLLEAKVAARGHHETFEKIKKDFTAAQEAYMELLYKD